MMMDREFAELLYHKANQFETEMFQFNSQGLVIARRTILIVRIVIILLLITALVIFWLLYDFNSDLEMSINNMVDMYNRFNKMSEDMDKITQAVVHMNQNIQGIPIIADSMSIMNDDVAQMQQYVSQMTQDVVSMDEKMTIIDYEVNQMANHFEHLNDTVYGMQYNVNQMSRPIDTIWPFR